MFTESVLLPGGFLCLILYFPEEKTTLGQKEIAELIVAAKNCKVSADEARRIKSAIAANRRDYAAASEQREQVAKLVEKREMQLANIAAEVCGFMNSTRLSELFIQVLYIGYKV